MTLTKVYKPDSIRNCIISMFSFSMAMTKPVLPKGSVQSMSKMVFLPPKALMNNKFSRFFNLL